MKSLGIAAASFIETIRQPAYLFILVVWSLLLFGSGWIMQFSFGREAQMIRESGVTGAVVAGLLIILLTIPGAISEEIRTKQILAVLAKPVSYVSVVSGKFIGLLYAVLGCFAVLIIAFSLSLLLREHTLAVLPILSAFYLAFLQVLIMGAVTLFFSIFLPMPATIIASIVIYSLGNLSGFLSDKLEELAGVMRYLGEAGLALLPDLMRLNTAFDLAEGRIPSLVYLAIATLYSGVYIIFMLIAAGYILSRKEIL